MLTEPTPSDMPCCIGRAKGQPSGIDGARSYRSGRSPRRRHRAPRTPAFLIARHPDMSLSAVPSGRDLDDHGDDGEGGGDSDLRRLLAHWRPITDNVELAGQIGVGISVLAAVVLGVFVRRREQGAGRRTAASDVRECRQPLPAWEWDGARWRRR